MRIAAVILAAGASTRFGARKQDVRIDGRRMVDILAATAVEAGLEPILAVVPAGFDTGPAVIPVVNPQPERGISHSLQLGIAALSPDVEAAIILLGDEPLVEAATLQELAATAEGGAAIVATRSGDRIGPPVLLRREAFGLSERATGDAGLGTLLRSLPDVATIALSQPPLDVDTRADLDALLTLRRVRRDG